MHGSIVDKKWVQAREEGRSTYASIAKALQDIPDYCMAKLRVKFDMPILLMLDDITMMYKCNH